MSRVQRSPPAPTLTPTPQLFESQSEPDVASIFTRKAVENVSVASRAKRLCLDGSFTEPTEMGELKEMLLSWKNEQALVLKEHTATLKTIVADMAELKAQSLKIQKTNSEIEKSIEFFNTGYEEMQRRIDHLEKERTFYKQAFEDLETKLQDVEFKSRSSSIEIRNVPIKEKETAEDLMKIVMEVGSKVEMKVQPNNIRDIYRLPGKPNTNRPIIAEFSSVITKMNFVSSVRSCNKNRTKEEKLNSSQLGMKCENRPILGVRETLPKTKTGDSAGDY